MSKLSDKADAYIEGFIGQQESPKSEDTLIFVRQAWLDGFNEGAHEFLNRAMLFDDQVVRQIQLEVCEVVRSKK